MAAIAKAKKYPRLPIVPSRSSGQRAVISENRGGVKCGRGQAAGYSSRGGTRGTDACLGRSVSFAGKYFRIVCSSNLQISSAIATSAGFSFSVADASIMSSHAHERRFPFIDESLRRRAVTLHHRSALLAGGIPVPPRFGRCFERVRAAKSHAKPCDNLV